MPQSHSEKHKISGWHSGRGEEKSYFTNIKLKYKQNSENKILSAWEAKDKRKYTKTQMMPVSIH